MALLRKTELTTYQIKLFFERMQISMLKATVPELSNQMATAVCHGVRYSFGGSGDGYKFSYLGCLKICWCDSHNYAGHHVVCFWVIVACIDQRYLQH